MSKKIDFTKMVASGNDFVVIIRHPPTMIHDPRSLARRMCDRKYGIGADGLLILEKVKKIGVRMRIFNADGSEAEMCGNGARCAALYACIQNLKPCTKLNIMTKAGLVQAEVNKDIVRIQLTEPKGLKQAIPIKVNGRGLKVNFINTGVPHVVIFAEGLDKIDVFNLGRNIRNHKQFQPAGTNVNFVEVLNNDSIRIRTYERGVEDETLACGTGSVASALITSSITYHPLSTIHDPLSSGIINVHTKGGEVLKVYYKKEGSRFKDVWLEGKASIVYRGVYNV